MIVERSLTGHDRYIQFCNPLPLGRLQNAAYCHSVKRFKSAPQRSCPPMGARRTVQEYPLQFAPTMSVRTSTPSGRSARLLVIGSQDTHKRRDGLKLLELYEQR